MSQSRKSPGHGGKRPGAGRPPVMEDGVRVMARVPERDVQAIDEEAEREGITRSAWIRRLIARALSR